MIAFNSLGMFVKLICQDRGFVSFLWKAYMVCMALYKPGEIGLVLGCTGIKILCWVKRIFAPF